MGAGIIITKMNPREVTIAILDARTATLIVRKLTVNEEDKLLEQVENMPEVHSDCEWMEVKSMDISTGIL